jgi:hypothetical protein
MESIKKSDSFVVDFIENYEANPCSWKVESKQYSDKNRKLFAYQELAEKLTEKDPEANKESVVEKSATYEVHLEKKWKYLKLHYPQEEEKMKHVSPTYGARICCYF